MSYVSRDPSLAWNLPGVVAYYQPVRAPGPQIARYNMAHGGDNRYKATDGVAPTWHGATGWGFNGSTQYLRTYVVLPTGTQVPYSAIVRYSGAVFSGVLHYLFGALRYATTSTFGIGKYFAASHLNGGVYSSIAAASGVYGLSYNEAYKDGNYKGAITAGAADFNLEIAIGCANYNIVPSSDISPYFYVACSIQAIAIWQRALSRAEMWYASRQMAYCDQNPDWNVWATRRRYWYAAQAGAAAGRVGVYGRWPTIALPGGVSISPMYGGET